MSATVRKAVIPAAGFGTRMLPFTKAVPKELLPLVDKPVIQYVVEEAINSGIDEILIILSSGKEAVINHFNPAYELEARLSASGKSELLAEITSIGSGAAISFIYQKQLNGLGDAVKLAEKFAGNDPFAVLLGDTVLDSGSDRPVTGQLLDEYSRCRHSVAAVEAVPQEKLSRYGVVGGTWERPGCMHVDTMVEKPAPGTAPSEFAVASRYVFTPEIFPALHATLPGKNNEIQLTDAMKQLAASGRLNARVIDGKRYDLGNKSGFITANVEFALRRSELAGGIETELEQILQKRKNHRV